MNYKTISSNLTRNQKSKSKSKKRNQQKRDIKQFKVRRQRKLRTRAFYILKKYSLKKCQRRTAKLRLNNTPGFVEVKIIKYFPDRTLQARNAKRNCKSVTKIKGKPRKRPVSIKRQNKPPKKSELRLKKKMLRNQKMEKSNMKSTVSARTTQRKFGARNENRRRRIEHMQRKYMQVRKLGKNQDLTIEF